MKLFAYPGLTRSAHRVLRLAAISSTVLITSGRFLIA